MSTWLVNNATPESLGIENVTLSFANMSKDVARVTFNLPYDAAVPSGFAFGSFVSIKLDGVQVFWGESQGAEREGSAASEKLSISVYGGWYELEVTPMTQYITDRITGGTFYSAEVTLTQDTVTNQVTWLINESVKAAAGAKVKAGTYDLPAVTIPSSSYSSTTYAEALRSVLKWIPGAQVIFDYSQANAGATPPVYPTVNVYQISSSAVTSIPQTDLFTFSSVKRDDMIPTGVKLVFQRSGTYTTKSYDPTNPSNSSSSVQEGTTHVLTESAGTISPARRAIISSINLSGGTTTTRQYFVFNSNGIGNAFGKFQDYLNSTYWAVGVNIFMQVADILKLFNAQGMQYVTKYWVSTPYYFWTPNSTYPLCKAVQLVSWVKEGFGGNNVDPRCMWMCPPSQVVPASMRIGCHDYYNSARLAGFASVTLSTGWSSDWTTGAQWWHSLNIPMGGLCWLWNQVDYEPGSFFNPLGYPVSREEVALDPNGEAAISGLAASTLTRFQTPYHQGSLSKEFGAIAPRERAVTVSGTKTPVQSVTFDANSMVQSANFGPPSHLAPQDLFSLLKAVAK